MLSLPPPMKTSKIQLHVEQLFLKTTWKLAKGSPITKAIKKKKKIHTESGRKRGEAVRLRPAPLAGDTEEEGRSQAQKSSLGNEDFKPHIGDPNCGVQQWGNKSPYWFENRWTYWRAVRNRDSIHEQHGHMPAYSQEQHRQKRLKTA